ncbi:MAG: putative cytochrome c oxidase subunit I [Acidimicrobiaceae bacterium]|nr:MAG: putative cytochrome c oxidase subunit I [Acidimicrobiaceae bacterium]
MTTIDPHAAGAGVAAGAGERTGGLAATVADWVTTTDHKKIGRLFIIDSLVVLLAMAAIGAVLGFERIDASANTIDANALPQIFSMYRVVLTFGVVAPLGLGLAIAIVPLQLGARALAFPRLAASGFWAWLLGSGLVIGSIIANGGPGGGNPDMVDLFLVGHVVLLAGLVAAAGAVTTSVLTTRAPGMNMRRVPMFAWSALVGSLGLVLMLPVVVGTLVLVTVDHKYGRTTFGGNTGVGEWLGFAFTQPATFVYAVPVFGLVADTIATATRRRLAMRGVALIGIGLVGSAFLAGVAQVDAGLRRDVLDASFSDALGDFVPFAVLNLLPLVGALAVFAVVMQAVAARPRIISPFVFSFLGAAMVLVGIAANALYHVGDAQLADTVFEEGAWIAVCYGAVLAALGGVTYWGPKLWGRSIADKKVLPFALLGFFATVLATFPYFVAGFADQPGGATTFDYGGPQDLWNTLSTVGHALMVLTVIGFVALALRSFATGAHAGDDPWDGQTLEWATSSPAPANNFAEIHVIKSGAPLLDLKPAVGSASMPAQPARGDS